MASTVLGSNDVKTGMKSAIKALGASNPFTINTAGEVSATVTVQGGMTINVSSFGKKSYLFKILLFTFEPYFNFPVYFSVVVKS